jgi:hypothetical protein
MDERYRTSETNMFLLEFSIKGFWGPKALQWGGMIQGVIRHESYTDPNKGENGTMPVKWQCIHGFIKAIGYGI